MSSCLEGSVADNDFLRIVFDRGVGASSIIVCLLTPKVLFDSYLLMILTMSRYSTLRKRRILLPGLMSKSSPHFLEVFKVPFEIVVENL